MTVGGCVRQFCAVVACGGLDLLCGLAVVVIVDARGDEEADVEAGEVGPEELVAELRGRHLVHGHLERGGGGVEGGLDGLPRRVGRGLHRGGRAGVVPKDGGRGDVEPLLLGEGDVREGHVHRDGVGDDLELRRAPGAGQQVRGLLEIVLEHALHVCRQFRRLGAARAVDERPRLAVLGHARLAPVDARHRRDLAVVDGLVLGVDVRGRGEVAHLRTVQLQELEHRDGACRTARPEDHQVSKGRQFVPREGEARKCGCAVRHPGWKRRSHRGRWKSLSPYRGSRAARSR